MFDDSLRLRDNPHLLALISHYAQQGTEDRATWRNRVMEMEGVEPNQLSVLHGELIAFDWIEQNTGQAFSVKDGILSNCYRITVSGLREFRKFHGVEMVDEISQHAEKPQPRSPRKKKQKAEAAEATATPASEDSPVTLEAA